MFRVEIVPILLGVAAILMGLALMADGLIPEKVRFVKERRRSERTERSEGGEAAVGAGMVCIGAALIGRDTWAYTTVAVIAGAVLFVIGAWANRTFLRDRVVNRGVLRRADVPGAGSAAPKTPDPPQPPRPSNRIR